MGTVMQLRIYLLIYTMQAKTQIRRDAYKKVLASLNAAILKAESNKENEDFEYFRDSVIQRFEYSIEHRWKLLKNILELEDGILPLSSPREVFKEAHKVWYIPDLAIYFAMLDSRNKLSHEYGALIAAEIYPDIYIYVTQLQTDRLSLQADISSR